EQPIFDNKCFSRQFVLVCILHVPSLGLSTRGFLATRESESFIAETRHPRGNGPKSYASYTPSRDTESESWIASLAQILATRAENAKRREEMPLGVVLVTRVGFWSASEVGAPREEHSS